MKRSEISIEELVSQDDLYIPCDCHTHFLQLSELGETFKDNDEWWELYITPTFLCGHNGCCLSWKDRLKTIWKIITKGKAAESYEFILGSPEHGQLIVDYLNRWIAKCTASQYGRTSRSESADKTYEN